MPVPFMAGLALVTKFSGAAGLVAAATSATCQVAGVALTTPEMVPTRRGLRRNRAARESAKSGKRRMCGDLQRGVGAMENGEVFKIFAIGTIVGTLTGTVYVMYHGFSTTAVPFVRETLLQGSCTALATGLMWLPFYIILTRHKDEDIEDQVPTHFFTTLVAGTTLFLIPSVLRMKNLAITCLSVGAPMAGVMLFVFVNGYSWMQSHKTPPEGRDVGPLVDTASTWLIVTGVVSGNLLAMAIVVTPFYHPGSFLVWGITNPALSYTMAIMAEAEIESAQVEHHLAAVNKDGERLVSPDSYMQGRLIRAMLPLLGLPFAYVADREDTSHAVKIALAGLGALGLGTIVSTFQTEWTALLRDSYDDIYVIGASEPVKVPRQPPSADDADKESKVVEGESF